MGWLPDYPSFKDYTPQSKNIAPLFKKVDLADTTKGKVLQKSLLSKQDLRKWCSPIEDPGQLGSCTANAGVGLVEYFERRAYGKHIDACFKIIPLQSNEKDVEFQRRYWCIFKKCDGGIDAVWSST
jgi:hypothetical protein